LSDLAGFDIANHDDDFEEAIKHVRAWLWSNDLDVRAPTKILGDYLAYQEWDWERLLVDGWSEDDIKDRSTPELFDSMETWVSVGRPLTDP
jgi:hypothetical protein